MKILWLIVLFSMPAAAQDWKPDYGGSQLHFIIKQMNVPVEGAFKHFAVQARFDPARVEGGQFRVEVEVASIDTGASEGDEEARRPAWFDAARYPKSVFVSKSVRKDAPGRYTAVGDLSVKGQTRTVSAAFTLSGQPGGAWLAEGHFPLKRSDFGVGGGDWNDVVANETEVRFRLLLRP